MLIFFMSFSTYSSTLFEQCNTVQLSWEEMFVFLCIRQQGKLIKTCLNAINNISTCTDILLKTEISDIVASSLGRSKILNIIKSN